MTDWRVDDASVDKNPAIYSVTSKELSGNLGSPKKHSNTIQNARKNSNKTIKKELVDLRTMRALRDQMRKTTKGHTMSQYSSGSQRNADPVSSASQTAN